MERECNALFLVTNNFFKGLISFGFNRAEILSKDLTGCETVKSPEW